MNPNKTWSERALFQSFWDDGLLDLLAGLALLFAGLGWQTRLGALAVLQAPLWIVFWIPLRRSVVEPRAGYVEFSLARRRTSSRSLGAALLLGLGCFMLALLGLAGAPAPMTDPEGWEPVAGLPSLILAVGSAIAALLTGARRFFLYALLLIALAAVTSVFAWEPGWPMAVAGGAMAACGGWLLFRFLRESRNFADTA